MGLRPLDLSMVYSTPLRRPGGRSLQKPAAWIRTNCAVQSPNFAPWKGWALFGDPTAPGQALSTWSRKPTDLGGPAATIAVLIRRRSTIGTPFLLCRILQTTFQVASTSPA